MYCLSHFAAFIRGRAARVCAALLLFLSLASPLALQASAADSAFQGAMDHLKAWNVMRGYADGDMRPNNPITRAEFVAMVNRAYGYTETGAIPFKDVPAGAWYADDIAIAFHAGYFGGTSATTASPNAYLTREQAMVLLARNMRLDAIPGEVTEFTDGRSFQSFSKGYVKAAVQYGLVSGYPDGTFRPKNRITRGQMAQFLYNAVGTLVNQPGEQTLSGVFGNVTINRSGVTLRDTTIAGDLYISGGLDLGAVHLENVRVLGRIVIAGGGESETGENSVVLSNVEANELLVDNLNGQYVSLSAEGDTLIPKTTLRSDAYVQDRTGADYGLLNITLEGAEGARFSLAGNLKNVINKSPRSTLNFAQGVAQTLTIDEKAVGSSLAIGTNATVKTLNLDVGVPVTGLGDVEHLNVNAPGSSTSMLPDNIVIRPDITANIGGQVMDSSTALEASADPRLLATYPKAVDVAPTSLQATFSGNKSGTVYWAISSISDGSVNEEELIAPASYGSKALKSGTAQLTASSTPVSSKVTGLTSGGSYYLSAVLVDARDARSPVKVTSFTTPDDTVPNFATGYPVMSKITDTTAQVRVMATKSCQLYYAVLPKGSSAPKAADFKAAAVTGNLGYGVVDMIRNDPRLIDVNNKPLEELTTYDLYLWLTDADGAKSSAVKKVTFTTVDKTPPVFLTDLTVNDVKATSIGLTGVLNENGTVYWAAVKKGTEYPKPRAGEPFPGADTPEMAAFLKEEYAKLQVSSGMNALKSGKVSAKENTNFSITVSGLVAETAYDIYYVAVDAAGNYSDSVKKLEANTLDDVGPTATQEFTRYTGSNKTSPFADTDIRIVFNEDVQRASTSQSLLTLYNAVDAASGAEKVTAKANLATALRNTIQLYNATSAGLPVRVNERTADADANWVIDYRNAKVQLTDGKLIVTFPTTDDAAHDSALNLSSGSTYYFQIEDIADTSTAKNPMKDGTVVQLPQFTTVSAQVALSAINITSAQVDNTEREVDMAFSLTPISTSKVEDSIDWDMLLWSDTSVSFELYARTRVGDGDPTAWTQVGGRSVAITTSNGDFIGQSLGADFNGYTTFPTLSMDLKENTVYEYAIHFKEVDGSSQRRTWSQQVNYRISVVSGGSVALGNLAANITESSFSYYLDNGITDIGTPEKFSLRKQFTDKEAPVFDNGYPLFVPGDSLVDMTVLLNRPGTIYYVVAPVGTIITKDAAGDVPYGNVPEDGRDTKPMPALTVPGYLDIVNPRYSNSQIKTGSISVGTGAVPIRVEGLTPKTPYFVYFIVKGTGQVYSESVQIYGFTTTEVSRPVITLDQDGGSVVGVKSNLSAEVSYILINYEYNSMNPLLSRAFKEVVSPENLPKLTDAQKADTFSVLNAMAANVVVDDESIGSLFDVYARQPDKDEVADYILASTPTSSGSIVGIGSVSLSAGRRTVVDCSRMTLSPMAQYAFLAVGKSNLGSGYAFRSIYPITLADKDAPVVAEVLNNLTVRPTGQLDGTVTLVFSEEIYYYEAGTTEALSKLTPLDNAPTLVPNRTDSGFYSVEKLVNRTSTASTLSLVLDDDQFKVTTNTITIKCRAATSGSAMTFQTNLCDQYGNGRRGAALSVSVYSQKDANGDFQPSVKISSAWDATV